tara:strand:+ start:359 stop:589 length:231 start_codon:yes stop_codon:yes gene_type:complete
MNRSLRINNDSYTIILNWEIKMKKLLGISMLVLFVASSASFACGCGCKADKKEKAKKEASKEAAGENASSCTGCSA